MSGSGWWPDACLRELQHSSGTGGDTSLGDIVQEGIELAVVEPSGE